MSIAAANGIELITVGLAMSALRRPARPSAQRIGWAGKSLSEQVFSVVAVVRTKIRSLKQRF